MAGSDGRARPRSKQLFSSGSRIKHIKSCSSSSAQCLLSHFGRMLPLITKPRETQPARNSTTLGGFLWSEVKSWVGHWELSSETQTDEVVSDSLMAEKRWSSSLLLHGDLAAWQLPDQRGDHFLMSHSHTVPLWFLTGLQQEEAVNERLPREQSGIMSLILGHLVNCPVITSER
ncbi:unnamed protein product [Pleuronectes platessa]|uniref:Uncharacterized protein n=1 Tax=Pleuronectes platessa TaxID=8262 RepID=A0A9N7ZAE1_PLEPL|nr:unnamed protein product [Pleuronectes platessa]